MNSIDHAIQEAALARSRAYCPYSTFHVGAATKAVDDERIFAGCNVENASYGGTICAERAAVIHLISTLGVRQLEFMVLISDATPAVAPCGICRQFLAEFASPTMPVVLLSPEGQREDIPFAELLPRAFGPTQLP